MNYWFTRGIYEPIDDFHPYFNPFKLERAGVKNLFQTLNTDYQLFSVFVFTVP
jgi:hypothetical protein